MFRASRLKGLRGLSYERLLNSPITRAFALVPVPVAGRQHEAKSSHQYFVGSGWVHEHADADIPNYRNAIVRHQIRQGKLSESRDRIVVADAA